MLLYDRLAPWWPLLSPVSEYAEEAAFYEKVILENARNHPTTMLELGSGGGNNASFLNKRFRMVLVDPSEGMQKHSKALNPECEHVIGDMRTVRLARQFDTVFVHDAVMYMRSEEDLRKAMETAWVHLKSGGVALFCPDHVKEHFRPETEHGGEDGSGRGIRWMGWSWDPDPSDDTFVVDYAYLVRDMDGDVRALWDRHVEGLFARETWLRLLREVGFEARMIPFDHSLLEPGHYEHFLARKPEPV